MKPTKINILGKDYGIIYCDNPADVDAFKRESLWGQLDTWTRTIRIYDNGRTDADILHTILHETLHAIAISLNIDAITKSEKEEEITDLLALALTDVITRNGWIN